MSARPLQVYFNEPHVIGHGPSLFLAGLVRPDIVNVVVPLPDGHTLTCKPINGFVLVAVPVQYAGRAHKGSYSLGFDSQGREVARGKP